MKFPTMFSPVQIGSVTVPNRFVVPPMGNNLANTDGSLSDRSLSYYEARAKGGFGLITIESTVVYEQAKGGPASRACSRIPPSKASARWPLPVMSTARRSPSSSSMRAPREARHSPATP